MPFPLGTPLHHAWHHQHHLKTMTTQKWCAQSCLQAWLAQTHTKQSDCINLQHGTAPGEEAPLALLEDCYRIAASIVTEHGDTYFPVFERLHRELEKRQKKQSLLKKAFEVSVDNSEKIAPPNTR